MLDGQLSGQNDLSSNALGMHDPAADDTIKLQMLVKLYAKRLRRHQLQTV